MSDTSITASSLSSSTTSTSPAEPSKPKTKTVRMMLNRQMPLDPITSELGQKAMGSLQSDSPSSAAFTLSKTPDSASSTLLARLDAKCPEASRPPYQSDFMMSFSPIKSTIVVKEGDQLPLVEDPAHDVVFDWIQCMLTGGLYPFFDMSSFEDWALLGDLKPGKSLFKTTTEDLRITILNKTNHTLGFLFLYCKNVDVCLLRQYSFTPSDKNTLGGYYSFKEISIPNKKATITLTFVNPD